MRELMDPVPSHTSIRASSSAAAVHLMDTAGIAGSLLTLQGAGAYDAAVHCASVSAARRMLQQRYLTEMLPLAAGVGAFRYLSVTRCEVSSAIHDASGCRIRHPSCKVQSAQCRKSLMTEFSSLACRPELAATGPSFTAAAGGSPEAAAAATAAAAAAAAQGLAGPSDSRPKKRLPAALSRKLRNFCDMLTMGGK